MGIEWFRDLSITILGFVTSVVLIFMAIMVYRLYREIKSTLLLVKATAKTVQETVTMVQESIKPMLSIMTMIQAIRTGFEVVSKMFKKESNEEGDNNE
jgi:predicted anti-sigma-YlaC factor YlaD